MKPSMWLTTDKKQSVEIEDSVVSRILDIYPEEKLKDRKVFQEAFGCGSIDFDELVSECDKILLPWQMFLLTSANLKKELSHIDRMRSDKVSAKLMSKRKGVGNVTSKRIIDRLIRLQNYLVQNGTFPKNQFCGSLVGLSVDDAVAHILSYFEIDITKFRGYKNKSTAIEYLMSRIESKYINISQGVLTNKMLPTWQVVNNDVYKNTSGFVIKDNHVPFVFLPSEVNPDEVEGRQIYTLVYLIAVIGLNEYDYYLEKDFKAKALSASGKQKRIHAIVSRLLIPPTFTDELKQKTVTLSERDRLASVCKVTPSAVVVTLRIRRILTEKEYDALLPPPFTPTKRTASHARSPKIETSVRKFCGKYPYEFVNTGISSRTIANTQAQYLLFGGVNKKNYRKYRKGLKI